MRLPSLRELTQEQKDVYLYAPLDHHVLVEGPPGTGKTLIASLRARELRERGQPVVLGMFNRVLRRFTANGPHGEEMPVDTVQRWFTDWWHRSGLPPCPHAAPLLVQCPYEDKDAVKGLGGRWDKSLWRPWDRKRGGWTITHEQWDRAREDFSRWKIWHNPPVQPDNPIGIDWAAALHHVQNSFDDITDEALSLGTLLIDEGQDFPVEFYKLLWTLCATATVRGAAVAFKPRCFVLADQNQQITEQNSTLDEIHQALKIPAGSRYRLLDNFRNTREIAELARRFFADVGVLPRLPSRRGEMPVYQGMDTTAGVAAFVARWVRNNAGKEVGVITFRDNRRQEMHDLLSGRLGEVRRVKVQTYSSRVEEHSRSEELLFDTPDTVTVLNLQSCKGLEFDAVFIVGLCDGMGGRAWEDRFQMQMFVATSRAREAVFLLDCGRPTELEAMQGKLPVGGFLKRVTAGRESEPASNAQGSSGQDPIQAAQELAKAHGLRCEDKRGNGGAFWVYGSPAPVGALKELGFKYADGKGWWRK